MVMSKVKVLTELLSITVTHCYFKTLYMSKNSKQATGKKKKSIVRTDNEEPEIEIIFLVKENCLV